MSLWDWALAAYARPGVADACLSLQDEHGQNVPLLLWAAWSGAPDPEAAAAIARWWERDVVGPLRGVRRALKPSALREEVKAVELSAERALLEALEALGPPVKADMIEALERAAGAWKAPPPGAALEQLSALLG